MSTPARKKVAYATHPLLEAAIHRLFRFDDIEQAYARLNEIRNQFILSRQQSEDDEAELRLWIRGFNITDAERNAGFSGHFATLRIEHADKARYTISTTKEAVPLSQHPQRIRPKQSHPDWGHPILRGVKKGKTYASIERADAELQTLHSEYPTTTIPGAAKLHAIIYERSKTEKGAPIRKYTLEIKPTPDGQFVIVATVNKRAEAPIPTKESKGSPQGRFTAMVQAKRKRKPPATKVTSNKDDVES